MGADHSPTLLDVSVRMLAERRQRDELRRLILIGRLLAQSVRDCASADIGGVCNADRVALADAFDEQLEIARPHLLRAEAPEKRR